MESGQEALIKWTAEGAGKGRRAEYIATQGLRHGPGI